MTLNGLQLGRRRLSPWAVALTLTVIALRGLMPTGFMLAPVDGELRVVFCGPGLHAHGQPASDGQLPTDHNTADASCPFAQSAGPAPLPALAALAPATFTPDGWHPPTATRSIPFFGPPRQQSPRGPPSAA